MIIFKRTLLIILLCITLLFLGLQLYGILHPLFILDPDEKYAHLVNEYQILKMERLVLEEKNAINLVKKRQPQQPGVKLAALHVNQEPIGLSLAESKTFEQLEAYVSSSKPLQPQAITHDEKSILEYRPDSFTLQLMGVRDIRELKKYIEDNHLPDARIIHTYYLNKDWYVLVSGLYQNHAEAIKAIDSLPVEIKNQKPWIRQISSLQKAIQLYHK